MKLTQGMSRPAHALWAALASMAALGYCGSACAQQTPLEPMVVTANRLRSPAFEAPASIDLVSGTDIRNARLQVNLAEGLSGVPGLSVHDRET